jgi:hypothetical protein
LVWPYSAKVTSALKKGKLRVFLDLKSRSFEQSPATAAGSAAFEGDNIMGSAESNVVSLKKAKPSQETEEADEDTTSAEDRSEIIEVEERIEAAEFEVVREKELEAEDFEDENEAVDDEVEEDDEEGMIEEDHEEDEDEDEKEEWMEEVEDDFIDRFFSLSLSLAHCLCNLFCGLRD